jgi:GTP-binding nuclear protein Ran
MVQRHLTGETDKTHVTTLGAEVYPLIFQTDFGSVRFDFWDIIGQFCLLSLLRSHTSGLTAFLAGQENAGAIPDGFYTQSQGAIVMFDVTAPSTYRSVPNWHRDVEQLCAGVPLVLCANKVDVQVLPSSP